MDSFSDGRINLVIIGDQVAQGYGDQAKLGVVGRILKSEAQDLNVIDYNLGIYASNSAKISKRLNDDLFDRFDTSNKNRLLIFMPSADIDEFSTSRSRLNLANMIDQTMYPNQRIMVVGPPPRNLDDEIKLDNLSRSLSDVCARRNVRYVDLFHRLKDDAQWINSMLKTDGKYPDQTGYGLLAWLVRDGGFMEFLR
ncbi:lysophospholipase [Actinomycetota bacterium]|nr:lysophospholipase [Actinomycetota bacterium]